MVGVVSKQVKICTYPSCILLSLYTQTNTLIIYQERRCLAEDHHVQDSQEAQESLTIRFPILFLSSNTSSLNFAAAVLTRCQHLRYYKRLATTSGTYTERLMTSVTVCRNSWLRRTTTAPKQPSLGACLIIKSALLNLRAINHPFPATKFILLWVSSVYFYIIYYEI